MEPRIMLNSIFKNEAVNLPRMLASVEPMIIGAAITDTGSTDDSIQIITDFFAAHNKPCWINRAPFIDFAQARNEGLRHARELNKPGEERIWDYVLLADADMELVITNRKAIPPFEAPAYAIMQDNNVVRYWNVRMLRWDQKCEYVGATHECITPDNDVPPVAIGGVWFKDHETGANRVDKYVRDIKLLEAELRDDPMNPRSIFYMVQSLLGAGMIERARQFCDMRDRDEVAGVPEERYWIKVQKARFDEILKREPDVICREYLEAYEFRPTRAEPLVHLATYLRKHERYELALLYARRAAVMPVPAEILPVEKAVYQWSALDEWLGLAIACEDGKDAWDAAQLMRERLRDGLVPEEEVERITLNCSLVTKTKKRPVHERLKDRRKG